MHFSARFHSIFAQKLLNIVVELPYLPSEPLFVIKIILSTCAILENISTGFLHNYTQILRIISVKNGMFCILFV